MQAGVKHRSVAVLWSTPSRTLLAALVAGSALWGVVAPQAGDFTPDSYAYALLGRSLWSGGGYASPAIRDFYGIVSMPQPSRSFPPLWPILVGGLDRLTGLGMSASLLAAFLSLALLSAAVAALARQLAPERPWLVWLALPALVLFDGEFRAELAAGRAIPLAMALQLAAFAAAISVLDAVALRGKAALFGILLGATFLTRVDEAFSCVGALIVAAWWCRRALGSRRAGQLLVIAGAAAALVYAPWAIRNFRVFGTPLASDNAITVASTYAGIVQICWFAQGLEPATMATAPGLWLQQRLAYLQASLVRACTSSHLAFPLAFALAALTWKSVSRGARAFVALALVAAAAKIAAVSLTPYPDLRYFSGIHLLSFLVAALVLAELAARKPVARQIAKLALLGLTVAVGLRGAQALTIPSTTPSRESVGAARFAALRAGMQVLPAGLVASVQADEFAYYTGLPAIYLPDNARDRASFEAWLRAFGPRYVVGRWRDVQSLGIAGAVRSRTAYGDVILEIDPDTLP